jgi:AmmeMemoRadiSam system protein A
MKDSSKKRLLAIARACVEAAVKREPPPKFTESEPELLAKQGAFVTLKNRGELRGCIGHFIGDRPLYRMVADMALASATEDYRFLMNPITRVELPQLDIEISVLSPLERIQNPLDIELGKHGIYIRRGSRAGCFLPQVATETGWSKEEFLTHCCAGKAGLAPDAWKDPKTEVLVFTAEVFGEKEE